MKKIGQFIDHNSKYNALKKPLEAAGVCDEARALARDRFGVVSYKNGLLCLSCSCPAAAANLSAESEEIKNELNKKLGKKIVENIRFKIG